MSEVVIIEKRNIVRERFIGSRYSISTINTPFDYTFQLQENSTVVDIHVPIGSYLLGTFQKTIANLLTANSPNSLTYTVTYPSTSSLPDTGKFTYTQSNQAIQSSLIFNQHL